MRFKHGKPLITAREQFIHDNPPKDGVGLIPLTKGKIAKVDEADYWSLVDKKWFTHGIYAARRYVVDGRVTVQFMHRAIFNPKDGLEVDHINNDGFDNRRANLRAATRFQNACNLPPRKGGRSRYKGVFPNKYGTFTAQINWNKRKIQIGRFDTEDDAARAYNAFANLLHGEFGVLNSVE